MVYIKKIEQGKYKSTDIRKSDRMKVYQLTVVCKGVCVAKVLEDHDDPSVEVFIQRYEATWPTENSCCSIHYNFIETSIQN